jgi:glutamyl-tRNA reductase
MVVDVAPGIENIVAVSVSHRWAPLQVIGLLEQRAPRAYRVFSPFAEEIVVLSTCNRFEAYAYSSRVDEFLDAVRDFLGDAWSYARVFRGIDAVRHLFRVASGLESAVVGENEILGQVAKAYEDARREGFASKRLSMLFQFAIHVGKLVRSKTGIARGNVGFPGAAVKLAWMRLGDVGEEKIVVVGAGEAGSIIAGLAREKWPRARIVIVNRSVEKAVELAAKVGGEARGLGELGEALRDARLVFVAINAPEPLVRREMLGYLKPGALIVDISVPPAVEQPVPETLVYAGLEEVKNAIRETIERRLREVPKAEEIIEEEIKVFMAKWERKLADEIIAKIMRYAETVASEELDELATVLRSRGIDGAATEPLASFARSLLKKLMRPLILYTQEQTRQGRLNELEALAEFFEREYEKRQRKLVQEARAARRN